ncbi:MAG: hypothetical protein R3A52_20480 [Polyangiales bacterium]
MRGYYWGLRRRILESWRPGLTTQPTLADALVAGLLMPVAGQLEAANRALGAALHPGRRARRKTPSTEGVPAA